MNTKHWAIALAIALMFLVVVFFGHFMYMNWTCCEICDHKEQCHWNMQDCIYFHRNMSDPKNDSYRVCK